MTHPAVHRVTTMPAGVTAGAVSPSTGSIRLAGEHFAAAMFYLLAGAVGLVWIAPELAAGNYLSPHVAGVTHLFTLGWLTMTIFGALHQLLPVALGAPIRWPKLGDASFWTFAPGSGLFACGVAENSTMMHHAGIALVGTGVILAIVNIAATLPRARTRDVTWAAIAIAISYLGTTLVLGVVLLHNVHTGFIAAARVRVLTTHLHVALIGWALVMMVGVAHRLLPMFLLAHGANSQWTKRALASLAIGVPLLAAGINTPLHALTWAGAMLMEIGLACFLYQAFTFHRVRVRKKVDVGMRFAGVGLGFLVLSALLGPIVLWRGPQATQLAEAYVVAGLLGGIISFVIGFFYKIVPLLSWVGHYKGKTGSEGVPTVAEMFSARVATVQLGIMPIAMVVLLVSILIGSPAGAYVGTGLLFVSVLLFASQIIRVARGGRASAGGAHPRGSMSPSRKNAASSARPPSPDF